MERFLKRRSGPAGGPSFDALPDELLLAVFQLLPEVTSQLLGSAFELRSRGSIERMCRRWRRLALQLPASLSIDLEQLEDLVADQEACAATVERLLPHLRCRNIVAMKVCNWTSCLAPEVPALLARAIYPELLSLDLGGSSLLQFTSFLPLCHRLEQLQICIQDLDDRQLLCTHLCGLCCSLQQLELHVDEPMPELCRIFKYVQPQAVTLEADSAAAMLWLPQLQHCTIYLQSTLQIAQLNSGLEAGLLPQLRNLAVRDDRSRLERHITPLALPGLLHLPALEQLECSYSIAPSAWRCRNLTSLLLRGVDSVAAPSMVQCTGLRQLHVVRCRLEGGAFPEQLCTTLHQLSNLVVFESGLTSLPPDFSQLSALQRLHIRGATITPRSFEAFRRLPGLTALHLRDCQLEGLPAGPYLSGLRSLDLSGSNPGLASPIPFAATAASGLQALRIRLDAPPDEWWPDVQWKLRCFPALKLLSLECELEEVAYMRSHFFQPDLAHVDELRELVRSELPPSCRLDIDSEELEYPQSANWPDL